MSNHRTNCLVQISPGGPDPLRINCLVPMPLRKGINGVIHIYAEGGTPPYFYSNVSGFVPGMGPIVSSNGMIVGTPTQVGVFPIIVQVSDADGDVALGSFTIQVQSRLIPREVTPVIGEYNLPYSYQFRVFGSSGSVTWETINGSLPPGLSLSLSGNLHGTPTDPAGGVSYFSVRATDTVTGDWLDLNTSIEIAPELTWVSREGGHGSGNPQILEPFIVGRLLSRPLRQLWTGGVPPYRILPDDVLTPQSLPFYGEIVRLRNFAGGWAYRCNPESVSDSAPGRFWVEDALGARAEIYFGALATTDTGSMKVGKSGAVAFSDSPSLEFDGELVTNVEQTINGIKVTIAFPDAVKISGTQVVGSRKTGWGTVNGFPIKTAWTIYSSPGTISSTYSSTVASQLTAALAHIQVLSQRLAALQNDLTSHGLIGP